MMETNLDKLYKLIENVYEELDKTKELISKLQLEARKEALKDIPGKEGVFDGKSLITDSGEKLEVPANYAAKSRIVFGDRLKAYEEEGKQLFKQVEKVNRKKVDAVVSKKEGKFYALSKYGDHELSPIAVEFNSIKNGERIQIILPEENLKAPFATLDKSLDQAGQGSDTQNKKEPVSKKETEVKKEEPKKEIKVEIEEVKKDKTEHEAPKEFVMDLTGKVDNIPVELPKKEQVKEELKPSEEPKSEKVKPEPKPFALDEDDLR